MIKEAVVKVVNKENLTYDAAFASYLFDTINFYRIRIKDLEAELAQFQNKI